MSKWNVSAPTLFILGFVVLLMLLIVVLPNVDLPATAFQRGTAPLAVHVRATTPPAVVAMPVLFQLPVVTVAFFPDDNPQALTENFDPNFLPIQLRSIRC